MRAARRSRGMSIGTVNPAEDGTGMNQCGEGGDVAQKEMEELEAEFASRDWNSYKAYPKEKGVKKRVEGEGPQRRPESLLRLEVQAEDVVEEENWHGWAEEKADAVVDEMEEAEDEEQDLSEHAQPAQHEEKPTAKPTTRLTVRSRPTSSKPATSNPLATPLSAVLESCRLPSLVELTIST